MDNVKSSKNIAEKLRVFQKIIIIGIVVVAILFFASAILEMTLKNSFCGLIKLPPSPLFIQASAIYEVITIVGFSSLLIGVIYANMEKKMLGLTYSVILGKVFTLYPVCSVVHIIAVLLCVAFSSTGFTEGAGLSFIIVLLGSIYQVVVVYNLIFNSRRCEKLAYCVWNEKLEESTDLDTDLCCLAKEVPEKGTIYYEKYLRCFAFVLVGFANAETTNRQEEIKFFSDVWYLFLQNPNVLNNEAAIEDLFQELFRQSIGHQETDEYNDSLCRITNGYIISRISIMQENIKTGENINFALLTQDIYRYRLSICRCYSENDSNFIESVFNCIYTNVYLLMWIYFWFGKTQLTQELINELPKAKNDKYIKEIIDILIKPFYGCSSDSTEILNIVMSQLDGRLLNLYGE